MQEVLRYLLAGMHSFLVLQIVVRGMNAKQTWQPPLKKKNPLCLYKAPILIHLMLNDRNATGDLRITIEFPDCGNKQ